MAAGYDAWSVQLALLYTGLPDVAGGVVPADFVQHLERRLQAHVSLTFRARFRSTAVLLHRSQWIGNDKLLFDGLCIVPHPKDEESVWYDMPRYFTNLFTEQRWPDRYKEWGARLTKDAVELRRLPQVDGNRIFALLLDFDEIHRNAEQSVRRMFDNQYRRDEGHSGLALGRQAAGVLGAMQLMIRDASYHKRSLPRLPADEWDRNYADTLRTYLQRARRRGVDLETGNVTDESQAAAAMHHAVMSALADRMSEAVGDAVARRPGALERLQAGLGDIENTWNAVKARPRDFDGMYEYDNNLWWQRDLS